MNKTTAKERVQLELKTEQENVSKAIDFVVKNNDYLNDAEILLLNMQIEHMKMKCEILKARLAIWRDIK